MNLFPPGNASHPGEPVWITGMGAVTPLGSCVQDTWSALLEGRDGMRPIEKFDLGGIACNRGGVVNDWEPPNEADRLFADPVLRFSAAAAREALQQAGRDTPAANDLPANIGVAFATNFGLSHSVEPWLTAPTATTATPSSPIDALCPGSVANQIAFLWNLAGPRGAISLSCSAGTAALAWAGGLIRRGRTDAMLVIGADAISPFAWYGLCALRTMTRDCVRPFDRDRSGTLFSEGAGAILLEGATTARARHAHPLAELRGWAVNNNAHHLAAPAPRGAGTARVLLAALDDAGMTPAQIDHFNAHGTGTQPNDVTESEAFLDVFGREASRIPVTANKSALGHMMGGAGAVEAILTVMSLRHGWIPPTLHVENQDPACPIRLVRDTPLRCDIRAAISNSAGIGGNNAAIVVTSATRTKQES